MVAQPLLLLQQYLDAKVRLYNSPTFIERDPISIPHRFTNRPDIEIAGLMAATLAWGNRTTIINSASRIMALMDNSPHQFITQHQPTDLKPMLGFAHRTFNTTDLLYFIDFLQYHYQQHSSLEAAFCPELNDSTPTMQQRLTHFHRYFFGREHPGRTRKHVATPERGSACKRLNMYLRWMVRRDTAGVDFGLWTTIDMASLVCPLDVHVARVAHRLGLLPDGRANWANATALTAVLKDWRPHDPVVYDYALFSLGAEEGF